MKLNELQNLNFDKLPTLNTVRRCFACFDAKYPQWAGYGYLLIPCIEWPRCIPDKPEILDELCNKHLIERILL